jgi:hypothetical protein
MRYESRRMRAGRIRNQAAERVGGPSSQRSRAVSAPLQSWGANPRRQTANRWWCRDLNLTALLAAVIRATLGPSIAFACICHAPSSCGWAVRLVFDTFRPLVRAEVGRQADRRVTGKSREPRRSGQGRGGDGRSAWARWEMSRARGGIRDCSDQQLGALQHRGNAREFDRQLPLREEVADQAVIRRILAGLDGVVGPIRIGSRARSMAGARQRMKARPTKRDGRVEREHRANQEMSNDSRHRNIVDE